MKKLLTILATALFGAAIGFACGGGQTPAGESTGPAIEEEVEDEGDKAAPTKTGGEWDEGGGVGGDSYGGEMYGGDAYGGY